MSIGALFTIPISAIINGDGPSQTCALTQCGTEAIGGQEYYTIQIPSSLNVQDLGPNCPAQGFVDNAHGQSLILINFACTDNSDGGLTLSFSTAASTNRGAVDSAMSAATDGMWPNICQQGST